MIIYLLWDNVKNVINYIIIDNNKNKNVKYVQIN